MADTDGSGSAWVEARTFEDLGEATAQWIEGNISHHPLYHGGIDDETIPLIETLAFLNRNGFVTTFSQPAEALDEEGCSQRACIEAYARKPLANRIATLGLSTELLVLIYPPEWIGGYQIPITIDGFRPHTWCGAVWGDEEVHHFADACGEDAIADLRTAWKVIVIDLQWGRNDLLWSLLPEVLIHPLKLPFDVKPADEGLDPDFAF